MTEAGGHRLRVVFPAGIWAADVERPYRASSRARVAAEVARRAFEKDGVPESELLACEPEGPDATQLEDCLKVYLPLGPSDPAERPFGMVFIDVGEEKPALLLLAFGVRHQPEGAHADSVYMRAHRRLHPKGK